MESGRLDDFGRDVDTWVDDPDQSTLYGSTDLERKSERLAVRQTVILAAILLGLLALFLYAFGGALALVVLFFTAVIVLRLMLRIWLGYTIGGWWKTAGDHLRAHFPWPRVTGIVVAVVGSLFIVPFWDLPYGLWLGVAMLIGGVLLAILGARKA